MLSETNTIHLGIFSSKVNVYYVQRTVRVLRDMGVE